MDARASSRQDQSHALRFEKLANTNERDTMNAGSSDGSVHLVGNRIYSFGNDRSIAVWTFGESEWHQLPAGLLTIPSHHDGDLGGDKIFLLGRSRSRSLFVEFDLVLEEVNTIECVLPAGLKKRAWMNAAYSTCRKEILFLGGIVRSLQQDPSNTSTIYCFNVESKSWNEIHMRGASPGPRVGQGVLIKGFELYSYGGYNKHSQYLDDLWIAHLRPFVPAYWTQVRFSSQAPTGRTVPCLNLLDDQLIVFGGYSDYAPVTKNIEIFITQTAEWKCAKAESALGLPKSADIELQESDTPSARIRWSVQECDSIVYLTTRSIFRLSLNV